MKGKNSYFLVCFFPAIFCSAQIDKDKLAFAINKADEANSEQLKAFIWKRKSDVSVEAANKLTEITNFSYDAIAKLQAELVDASAVVALSPYDTRPSAIKAAESVHIPTLIFSGSIDCITPSDRYHLPLYNASSSTDKAFILIKGGTHCQMGVSHPKCRFGEKLAGCKEGGISREKQMTIIQSYLIPWLKYYLKGDSVAGCQFSSVIMNDKEIDYELSGKLMAVPE